MTAHQSNVRVEGLRKVMRERNIQAYYIPTEDAHQSEYIAKWDARREFISGFTGSAGSAIVTEDDAALWTDGRYFLQAEKQLGSGWQLMKAGISGTPSKEDWLAKVASAGSVGVDAKTISFDDASKFREVLKKHDINLELIHENLVDIIWTDRPKVDLHEIFLLPAKYSGRESSEKIASLRSYLSENGLFGFVVTALDEVAWLFNLRGSDIQCNPTFFSYAFVTKTKVRLYLDESKLTAEARTHLDGVEIRPYTEIFEDLKGLRGELEKSGEKLLISSGSCNAALVNSVGVELTVAKASPVQAEKAIKNSVELAGLRKCHLRDAVALVRYFCWLENQLKAGKIIDEVDGSDKLLEFRQEEEHFKGMSFDTISGAGPNGAIIHYKPAKPSAAKITIDQLYLCDSGGQYLDGTTDVTRTVHFGQPSAQEKDSFTRVLLGNIALDRAVFPVGTTGFMLDCLARLPLWQIGLDYRHGTGHGVGHFLNVHEGPQSISFHVRSNDVPLKSGMTITNEPGLYLDGQFGIRIENLLVVVDADTANNFGGARFLKFDNITMVPIQTKLIDMSLMTEKDIDWVNQYHAKIWDQLSSLLSKDQPALAWLHRETQPIAK